MSALSPRASLDRYSSDQSRHPQSEASPTGRMGSLHCCELPNGRSSFAAQVTLSVLGCYPTRVQRDLLMDASVADDSVDGITPGVIISGKDCESTVRLRRSKRAL